MYAKSLIHTDLNLPSRIRHIVGRKGNEKTIYINLKAILKFYLWGLDTLHLTYKGVISKTWWQYAYLKERKKIAQTNPYTPLVSSEGVAIDSYYVSIGNQDWVVSPSGSKEYAYCLLRNDWRIFILSNRGLKNSIQLKIEIPSSRLRMGLFNLRKEISYLLKTFDVFCRRKHSASGHDCGYRRIPDVCNFRVVVLRTPQETAIDQRRSTFQSIF